MSDRDEVMRAAPQGAGRMRYRVVLTIVDQQTGRASVQTYDTDTLEVSRGAREPDPFSGRLVQDVRIRLATAVLLGSDDVTPTSDGTAVHSIRPRQ